VYISRVFNVYSIDGRFAYFQAREGVAAVTGGAASKQAQKKKQQVGVTVLSRCHGILFVLIFANSQNICVLGLDTIIAHLVLCRVLMVDLYIFRQMKFQPRPKRGQQWRKLAQLP